jgi:beta-lactamase regulating signal transducer with metallopeptidase domain
MNKAKLVPKSTKTYEEKLFKLKSAKNFQEVKPPYKMKIFSNIPSKVKNIYQAKSKADNIQNEENIDRIINRVEDDIKHLEQEE